MDKARDNEAWAANADAHKDDELSTEEMDKVAGGVQSFGPDAAAGKGYRAGPEWDNDKSANKAPEWDSDKGAYAGPEKSA